VRVDLYAGQIRPKAHDRVLRVPGQLFENGYPRFHVPIMGWPAAPDNAVRHVALASLGLEAAVFSTESYIRP
jgi:hypothetical protein